MDPTLEAAIKAAAREAANEAAHRVAHELFLSLGINAEDPLGVQRDMAALREIRKLITDPEWQKDMLHVRRWRVTMDAVQRRSLLTAVALLTTGAVTAIFMYVTNHIGK